MKNFKYILVPIFTTSIITMMVCYQISIAENPHVIEKEFTIPEGMNIDAQLIEASRNGSLSLVKGLVRAGATINPSYRIGNDSSSRKSPLLEAVKNGHLDVVEFLATHGATFDPRLLEASNLWGIRIRDRTTSEWRLKVPSKTRNKLEIILNAISIHPGKSDSLSTLSESMKQAAWKENLNNREALNARDTNGQTSLHIAATRGDIESLKHLLAQGADPNALDNYGNVPLRVAIQGNQVSAIEALSKGGADANFTRDEYSLLMQAVAKASLDTVRALIRAGADVNQKTTYGATPLTFANRWNPRPDIVRVLRKHGASDDVSNSWKQLVEQLKKGEQSAAINFLRENRDDSVTDIIHAVAANGNDILLQLLLKQGISVDRVNREGSSALHHAAKFGKENIVKILLQAGAPVDLQSNLGETALILAAKQGHAAVIKTLLEANADPEIKNWNDQTALDIALDRLERAKKNWHYKESIELLSTHSEKPSLKQSVKLKELLTAIVTKDSASVETLVRNKSLVNMRDELGFTPLHWSVYFRNPNILTILLSSGANPNLLPDPICNGIYPNITKGNSWSALTRKRENIVKSIQKGSAVNCTSPLLAALRFDCPGCVQTLLTFKADPNLTNSISKVSPLMIAAGSHSKERLKMVNMLISYGAKADQIDIEGNTALMYAAERSGNGPVTETLLNHGSNIHRVNNEGKTAYTIAKSYRNKETLDVLQQHADGHVLDILQLRRDLRDASKEGMFEKVQQLVMKGADVNYANYWGNTPLSVAASRCRDKVIEYLLSKGARPNSIGYQGYTPLMLASRQCTPQTLKILLEAGANPNYRNWKDYSTFSLAAGAGHVDNCELLIQYADTEYREHAQEQLAFSKLIVSAMKGNRQYLSGLQEGRQDLNAITIDDKTPLIWAIWYDQREAIQLLVNKGADVNGINSKGETPLMWASSKGNLAVVKTLLSLGASVNMTDHEGRTPLMWSVWNKRYEITRLLLEQGADIDARTKSGATALLFAVQVKDLQLVKLLIQENANPRLTYYNGDTVLSQAVKSGDSRIVNALKRLSVTLGTPENLRKQFFQALDREDITAVKGLIKAGVDPNTIDGNGNIALHDAMCRVNTKLAKVLLEHGADVNLSPESKGPAISYSGCRVGASDTSMREIVTILLDYGAKTENSNGAPIALSSIIHANHPLTTALILEHGANVNARDDQGRTPLIIAADRNRVTILKLLLEHGADPLLTDRIGRTALDLAESRGFHTAVQVLKNTSKKGDTRE